MRIIKNIAAMIIFIVLYCKSCDLWHKFRIISKLTVVLTFLNVNPCLCNVLPIVVIEAIVLHTSQRCSCNSSRVFWLLLNAALKKLEKSQLTIGKKDMNKLTCASRPSIMRGQPGNSGSCSLISVYHRIFWSLALSFKDICNAISLSSWAM